MADTTGKNLLHDPVPMTLRFERALLQQIQESAKRSLRSTNAQINHLLRASFERKPEKPAA